jgi:hypothetical protein
MTVGRKGPAFVTTFGKIFVNGGIDDDDQMSGGDSIETESILRSSVPAEKFSDFFYAVLHNRINIIQNTRQKIIWQRWIWFN